ncbi:MAG: hypothetical protein K2P84_05810 [Undibacterium sp.]|nr:hypothetical protein [Undibacterium sp.]
MSQASVLIATDVFADTAAVSSIARYLDLQCHIVSPFDTTLFHKNEQTAYQHFLACGGVASYAKKITNSLREQCQISHVIAFSVGASAWWLQCETPAPSLASATLFYGSRIRDYPDLQAHCPTQFIFAEQEAAYPPAELVASLRRSGHQAEIAKGTRHGFMNPYSAGFSLKAQTHYLELLGAKLRPLAYLAHAS